MGKISLLATILIAGLIYLQTTLLSAIAIRGATPDLALLVLLYVAHRNGKVTGQVTGFATGLLEDVLSLSPLGFHAMLKTVIGYIWGHTRGRIFQDAIFVPILFAVSATLMKGLLATVLDGIVRFPVTPASFASALFWIELLMNTLLAPFVFAVLELLPFLKPARRDGTL